MKKPDTKAASVLFGVELETVIPAGCGVQVGNYHRGVQVTGGLRKSDGTVVTAPKFNRMPWRAEHDGSIRGAGVACEFVSPILHGEDGVAALCQFVEFMTTIESNQVPELDRGQTCVAQVADFPNAAADVAGQVIGGPKAFVRSVSAGLFRFRQ